MTIAHTSDLLVRHAGKVIVAALVLTLALVPSMLFLASDEIASTEPGGEVFDLRDEIDDKLRSRTYPTAYVAEARDGDILTQAPLLELYRNEQALRDADANGALTPGKLASGSFLKESFNRDAGVTFTGVVSIADAVQAFLTLAMGTTLEQASDDQVKITVSRLLADPRTESLADQLSVLSTSERRTVNGVEIDYWVSPAVLLLVLADNDALGGTTAVRGIATDEAGLNLERFGRNVQEQLRGEQVSFRVWGLAIDQTLAAQEQGATAGTFIVLTVIAALVVVGLSLRAYWPTALTAIGLGALMIWLKGLSALVGLEGGIIIELIVPIAMVSLGVDFAVHAARRYQEERDTGLGPQRALVVGFTGVIGALVLAMLSDGIAFLSNVPSGIEAVVHFGLAAGIAVLSSFIVLGVVLPLALMRIDLLLEATGESYRQRPSWLRIAGGAGVAVATGAGVILLVAFHQGIGAAVLGLTAVLFVGGPVLIARRRAQSRVATPSAPRRRASSGRTQDWVVALVSGLASRPLVVLPIAALLTSISVVFALRLEATFDVKDFFSSDSDIVVGLDKLDEHVGDRGGEGGIVYFRGDLARPEVLLAIESFIQRLADNPFVGHEADGRANVFERNVLGITQLVTRSDYARGRVQEDTGIELTDTDDDGLPDSREQMQAVFAFTTAFGVPLDESTDIYSADQVNTAFFYDPAAPGEQIATLLVGIPGTRELSIISEAREALLANMAGLSEVPGITQVGLTGSPFVRDAELTATADNLRRSLPIAAVGAFILLLVAMRSLRYALVTVVPIGLVVVWLYAIMEVAGFALNFVSATIGAVSIGVGIDYSIHMTERFREEITRTTIPLEAVRRASAGTGVALLGSAGSSVVGFTIMGFAPMPMFSTYGILTALMIFLALSAALVVLPSLLLLVTPKRAREPEVRR
jgi:predicted RND superfamily exporter protein